MRFSLSIVIDKNGYNRQDLYKTNTLKEMDDYLLNFKDHLEVRDKYSIDISEFLLDNMKYIRENEKKNNRENNGRICITYIGKNNEIRMFPIIYRNSPKLLKKDEALHKIKKVLSNNETKLKELYDRKRYLLSGYECDLIRDYLDYPVSYKRFKYIFINDFISRLSNLSDDKLYMYLRSLMNLCELKSNKRIIVTKYGDINTNMESINQDGVLNKEGLDNCNDDLFIKLYSEEDYDNLYNLYDLEEMEKYGILDKKTERRK